jgi:peptidoglycan/LPS O-acetylase OafA/YrhL
MAVPAFLAISGVVVLKSYSEKTSLKDFAIRRILRIIPALTASLLLTYFLFDFTVTKNSITTWLTGGIYLPKNGYTNQALWSLAWEELSYLMLAFLWFIGAYKKPILIWGALALTTVIAFSLSAYRSDPLSITLALLAQAFFVGNLAFLYRARLKVFGLVLPWVFLIALLVSPPFPMRPLLQAAAIVLVGISGYPLIRRKLPDISYGIYIYHIPILLFITEKLRITDILNASVILVVVLIPTCIASWFLIEQPCIRFKRRNHVGTAIRAREASS